MILQCAEVVHLRAVGEIQRNLFRRCTLTNQSNPGTNTRVVTTECNGGSGNGRVTLAECSLVANEPSIRSQLVDRNVGDTGGLCGANLHHRHHERTARVVRNETLHHGDFAVLCCVDFQRGKAHDA